MDDNRQGAFSEVGPSLIVLAAVFLIIQEPESG